jgi:hypothetical protein
MPVTIRLHSFERKDQLVRTRDMASYQCTRCNCTVRISSRTMKPLEEKIAVEVKVDCPGAPLARAPKGRTINENLLESLDIIRTLLKSAVPHPVEHPTMTAAWKQAEEFLERVKQGPQIVCVDDPSDSFAYQGADIIEYQGRLWRWGFVQSHGKMAYVAFTPEP